MAAYFEHELETPIERGELTHKRFKDQVTIWARLSDRQVLAVELIDIQGKPIMYRLEDETLPSIQMSQTNINIFMAAMEASLNEDGEFIQAQGEEPVRALKSYEVVKADQG